MINKNGIIRCTMDMIGSLFLIGTIAYFNLDEGRNLMLITLWIFTIIMFAVDYYYIIGEKDD